MSEMTTDGLRARAAEHDAEGPVHHKGPGPPVSGWLDPRGRTLGGRSFALHRLTGLALIVYLYVHLGVLSMLLVGKSAWGSFLGTVTATGFVVLDVVLIFGVLFHGLNGIRVALVGSGIGVSHHKAMFWAGSVVGTCALIYVALRVLGALS
jgi:succinate dehydrogenase / fumarate reductase cytochrome b subunit